MKKKTLFLLMAAMLSSLSALSQDVNPQAYYTNSEGVEQESRAVSDGEAPLDVIFRANPSDMDDYTPSYEWHFRKVKDKSDYDELFVRYEEDTQYTFRESGTFHVVLKTMLNNKGEELDSVTITITISESKLEFPNAFSPNGDGFNDTYKAKTGWKNIVKFRAIILNRWGQKLYEWNDPAGEWDGTYNGHDVKEGVYFVQVTAKGSDGREYNIRKDVNLIRGYTEGGSTSDRK